MRPPRGVPISACNGTGHEDPLGGDDDTTTHSGGGGHLQRDNTYTDPKTRSHQAGRGPRPAIGLVGRSELTNVESEQMEGMSGDNEPRTYAELTAPTEGYTPVDMGTTNEMS